MNRARAGVGEGVAAGEAEASGWARRRGRAGRWLAEHRFVLLLGLAASIPIIVSTTEVILAGWVPLADDAMMAVSAYEVPTGESPLLGAWSSGFTDATGRDTFHPGPMLFWLLGVPARVFAPGSMQFAAGLINVASVMAVVGLARRRGGFPLMLAVALGIPVMLASLPAEAYSDIWNPYIPLLPFLLLIFLCWSVACGEIRLLPLTVAVASLAPQGHLSFLVPAAALLAVALVGLVIARRADQTPQRPSARPWVAAALGVGLLCWIGPLLDQAMNRPGNLVLIGRAILSDDPTLGFDQGWRAVVHTVGLVPWWLEDPSVGLDRVIDLTINPSIVAIVSAAAFICTVVALLILGIKRARTDVAAAAALTLVLCAAAAMVTASTPEKSFATLGYTLRWASPAGMFAWVATGWGLATLTNGLGAGDRWNAVLARRRQAFAVAGVVLVAAAGALVGIRGELRDEPYEDLNTLAAATKGAVEEGRVTRLEVASDGDGAFLALGLGAGLVYQLRTDGRQVTAPTFANYLGSEYTRGARGGDEQAVRLDVGSAPPRGWRRLARLEVTDAPDPGDALAAKTNPIRTVILSVPPKARVE